MDGIELILISLCYFDGEPKPLKGSLLFTSSNSPGIKNEATFFYYLLIQVEVGPWAGIEIVKTIVETLSSIEVGAIGFL